MNDKQILVFTKKLYEYYLSRAYLFREHDLTKYENQGSVRALHSLLICMDKINVLYVLATQRNLFNMVLDGTLNRDNVNTLYPDPVVELDRESPL